MHELIAHLVGDYLLQNHMMANLKTKKWRWAVLHAVLYTLPFLVLTQSPAALAVICGSHLIIDHYRLAQYWVRFWGVGEVGQVCELLPGWNYITHVSPDGPSKRYARDFPHEPTWVAAKAPDWLSFWLLVIADNTLHLTINSAALQYL